MAAGRLHARHAGLDERLAEIGGRADPIAQVVVLHDLAQAGGHRLEVAAGEPAVRRKALGQDQHVAALLRPAVVVQREPAADVGERVLLAGHRHPVGQGRHLAHDVGNRGVGVALLALLDEPRVLGEPARVEEERQPVSVADGADRAQVGQADRLAAAGVVRDRDEHDRDVLGARARAISASSASVSMLPLNGWMVDGDRGPRR